MRKPMMNDDDDDDDDDSIVALCEPPPDLKVRFCDICLKSGENREPWRSRIVCRECRRR